MNATTLNNRFSPEARVACEALELRWRAERRPGTRYLTRLQVREALADVGQVAALVALHAREQDRALARVLRALDRAAGSGGAR